MGVNEGFMLTGQRARFYGCSEFPAAKQLPAGGKGAYTYTRPGTTRKPGLSNPGTALTYPSDVLGHLGRPSDLTDTKFNIRPYRSISQFMQAFTITLLRTLGYYLPE